MLKTGIVLMAFVLSLLTVPTVRSQQTPAPTHLALEVYYYANQPPAYVVVPGGSWFGRFRHVAGWSSAAGELPVDAVNIRPVVAGDTVRVFISVFLGTRHEQERDVAAYTLRENEKVRVQELTQFGVEPFELALVRIASPNAELPQVISKARSIELVAVRANLSTLPSYQIALRNLSHKNVSALSIRVRQGDHTVLSSMPQGKEGNPLISAGGIIELTEKAATRAAPAPGGYQPTTPPDQICEISAAVFEDGSFEGDIESAATFRAFVKGRRIQLRRIVDLFQDTSQDDSSDPSTALNLLLDKISGLGLEADATSVQEVASEFPALPEKPKRELKSALEIAMSSIRRDVLNDIQQFRAANPKLDSGSLHTWLVESKQRYEAWLSRL